MKYIPLNLQIFEIYTPKSANFDNFPPKNANFDNFFPKKYNFGQFSTSESEKYGGTFSQDFCQLGKKYIFLAEFSPMLGSMVHISPV